MKATEDDYTDGTTSSKEYKPRTCCIAYVIILGESCSAVVGSNPPKWSKSRFADCCERFFSRWHCRGPRHRYNSRLAYWRAAQYVRCTKSSKLRCWIGGWITFHALHWNTNSVTMHTCDVLLRHFRILLFYMSRFAVSYSHLICTLGRTKSISLNNTAANHEHVTQCSVELYFGLVFP